MDNINLKELYELKKTTILKQFISSPDSYSNSYVFAIYNDLYPVDDEIKDDTDNYKDFYKVDKDFMEKVRKIIAETIDNNQTIFYYELQTKIGGSRFHRNLILALRYFYLAESFSKDFFNSILQDGQMPGEAKIIEKEFTPEEISF